MLDGRGYFFSAVRERQWSFWQILTGSGVRNVLVLCQSGQRGREHSVGMRGSRIAFIWPCWIFDKSKECFLTFTLQAFKYFTVIKAVKYLNTLYVLDMCFPAWLQ